MKVGDLVAYHNDAYPTKIVGVVLRVVRSYDTLAPIRVRWTNHLTTTRDWYRTDELAKL